MPIELIAAYPTLQVPYIANNTLDKYAVFVVNDFSPECLKTPSPHDVIGFIQNYLKLKIVYHRLYCENHVLGFTTFRDCIIHVLDERTGCMAAAPVNSGTVIINKILTVQSNIRRLRFTLAHEASHWLLHRKVFENDCLICNIEGFTFKPSALRTGIANYSRSRLEKTKTERIEWQADFLAAAILMPLPALRIAYSHFFRSIDEKPQVLIHGVDSKNDYTIRRLIGYIANMFEVSNHAALIRLEKLNAISHTDDTHILK